MQSISVRHFCSMAIEPTEAVIIWSASNSNGQVYRGTFGEVRTSAEDWSFAEVQSFGVENGVLCINIE